MRRAPRARPRPVLAALLGVLFVSPTAASTCYGTPADGALRDGCRLPVSGDNFSSYTRLGSLLGRTWVHCAVAEVVEASFDALAVGEPGLHFVLGESGRARGGELKPHRTHRNGLSIDFMVPVRDRRGRSVPLPTGPGNKFGYGLEFDAHGVGGEHTIDFAAITAHLAALDAAARRAGIGIARVIFDPELQPRLHPTASWPSVRHLAFSTRRAWVRHDEHYHVDFAVPCRPLAELDR